jgi:ATP-dependent protease ClpP protease subunit
MSEHAYHGVERVVLDVSSPGGEVKNAMILYNKLCSVPFELITRNTSEVASMGMVMFLAGDRRLASPEGTFLLHPITFDDTVVPMNVDDWLRVRTRLERNDPRSRLVEVCRKIRRLEREEEDVRKIIEQRTNLTGSTIRTLVRESKLIDADEAVSFGIVHEIIPISRA